MWMFGLWGFHKDGKRKSYGDNKFPKGMTVENQKGLEMFTGHTCYVNRQVEPCNRTLRIESLC